MGITIKDIAKSAGVSYSTVSKALLDSPLVRDDTKKKIVDLANELGYQPNVVARSLVSKKSNTIGVVWPTVERVAHSALITKINKQLEDLSYTTLLSINPISDAINTFNRFQVDAILVFDDSNNTENRTSTVPVVSYGIANHNNPYPIVDANRREAIKSAVHHLHQNGHTKIFYIGNLSTEDLFQEEKVKGFRQALLECGIAEDPHSVVTVAGLAQYDGYLATRYLLESNKPTAIISGSQDLALGIVRAINESNLVIPADISIISYDNIPQSKDLSIPLSIVGVPLDTIAEKLTEVLMDVVNDKKIERSIILEPELNITESCHSISNKNI